MAITIDIDTARPYQVHVGTFLLEQAGPLVRTTADGTRAVIVTDTNVGPLYQMPVKQSLEASGYEVSICTFEAGEAHKRAETYVAILEFVAEHELSRSDVIVALGGGVVGDVAGFVAATYMRGCKFVQIPTSLLAMVDSSVGGKTAIDLAAGKNLAGAFWQPSVVIAENGAVEVQVSVAEDVFTGIKVGDTASVTVSAVSKESMNGTVSTLPAAANAQTNLYDVSVSLPSGTKPPIGAFATVTFYTDRRASTISVPTESILTGNNNEQYVFTVNADGTAATRVTVTTGLVTKDSTEIVSGLKAGDRVVTKGQSYLSGGAGVHVVTSDAADGGEG